MAAKVILMIAVCTIVLKGTYLQDQSIPKHLLECYLDDNDQEHEEMILPMTMNLFIELLRKIEMEPHFSTDLGVFINALLRRFWRDGIVLDRGKIPVDPDFIPYLTSGDESFKYDFVTKYIIPGTRGLIDFNFGSLTKSERCTLHRMLSRSVDIWERGNEFTVCQNYLDVKTISFESEGFRRSSCPIERGLVWAGDYRSVSLSNVLVSIVASLQPMNIPVSYILQDRYFENETIDNKWTSLTGDLSEVLITQIPLKSDNFFLGPGGKWNDTDLPTEYYMNLSKKTLRNKFWQFTDAEILGAIDGLMMAEEATNWLTNGNSLRLSQLFEAFYSKLYKENSVRAHACKRRTFFENNLLTIKNISRQVENFAAALSVNMPNYIKNYSVINSQTPQLLNEFSNYAANLLWNTVNCPQGIHSRPKLKMTLVTDTTWAAYDTLKFIMNFGENIDVSTYGSKITIIKGDNGNLIAESENSLGKVFQKWRSVTKLGVPSLPKSLLTVRDLALNRSFEEEPYTHVTLFLATLTILSDNDLSDSITLLKSIRNSNPDMYFIYVTSTYLAPMYVRLTSIPWSKDDKIISEYEHLQTRIFGDLNIINKFYRSIIPRYCNNATGFYKQKTNVQFTNRANPGEILLYRIHPCYLSQTDQVNIEIQNSNKGNVIACIARHEEINEESICKEASLAEKINFPISNPCPARNAYSFNIGEWRDNCKPIFIRITGKRSYSSCTDQLCRMPDDIPFTMTVQGLKCILDYPICSRSKAVTCDVILIISLFVFLIQFYMGQFK